MNIEDASVAFLEKQIDTNFKSLCESYMIYSVEWLEDETDLRPFAQMSLDEIDQPINLYILFPPLNKNLINNQ